MASQVQEDVQRRFTSRREVILAQAVSNDLQEDGRIDFKFIDSNGEVQLPYDEILTAFKQTDLSTVLARNIRVRTVIPNEELAIVIAPKRGTSGLDIFGRPTTRVIPPGSAYLKAGDNVRVEDDHYYSEIYGYVCVAEDEISVIPPIWISPDSFRAHYVHFLQAGSRHLIEDAWMDRLLAVKSIKGSLSEGRIVELRDFLSDHWGIKGEFQLMEGRSPELGENGNVVCCFEGKIGGTFPDGSVDFEARQKALSVQSGDLVAEVKPPTEGTPGENLRGEEIPTEGGKPFLPEVGKNVRVELEEETPKYFYAEVDGNANFDGVSISVNSVMRIGGDIDEATGDINAEDDIEISGSVRGGLKIKSAGNITIGGMVEVGASITAKGDVIVSQGVMGPDTKIVALGAVETKFVQDGSVMARKDVLIGDHLMNSFVRVGGWVSVRGGEGSSSGSIVGGET